VKGGFNRPAPPHPWPTPKPPRTDRAPLVPGPEGSHGIVEVRFSHNSRERIQEPTEFLKRGNVRERW
jgi:hypothetical protein